MLAHHLFILVNEEIKPNTTYAYIYFFELYLVAEIIHLIL